MGKIKSPEINMERALRLAGEYVVGKAKENLAAQLHHSNGILLNSVEYWFESPDTICIGTKLEYGVYVELGTGLFAKNGDGRKDVPWVYHTDEPSYESSSKKTPIPNPSKAGSKKPQPKSTGKKEKASGSFYTTYGQHPNPWLYPALNDNKDTIKRILGENMEIEK